MRLLNSKIGRIVISVALVFTLLVGVGGSIAWYKLFREVPTYYESPADHFKYGSIGAEATQGLPYWLWMVLPRLFPEYLPGAGGYTSLGITWEPGEELPIGFSKKTIGFPRQGITCALCHTATYHKTAEDVPTIIPTGASSRFNLQGYIRFLSNCGEDPRFNADYILAGISYVRNLSLLDKFLYRYIIIPQTKKALVELQDSFAWMDKRPEQGLGRIAPFNPVKFVVLGLDDDGTIGNSDMMPLWNQKLHKDFALHWDGLETSLTETTIAGAIG
ncbi:MAG: cytochrome c, partial [Oscillatoria sp. SIO1A7]|nr:cytochrome c [Oscillatoria sp. SIO1A7]